MSNIGKHSSVLTGLSNGVSSCMVLMVSNIRIHSKNSMKRDNSLHGNNGVFSPFRGQQAVSWVTESFTMLTFSLPCDYVKSWVCGEELAFVPAVSTNYG